MVCLYCGCYGYTTDLYTTKINKLKAKITDVLPNGREIVLDGGEDSVKMVAEVNHRGRNVGKKDMNSKELKC